MKDDFRLFADAEEGPEPVAPDIALITAYLARELSAVQVQAVENRLSADPEFRAAVEPIIVTWAAPAPVDSNEAVAVLATHDEIDEGWRRFLAERTASSPRAAGNPSPGHMPIVQRAVRIAALIVIALLPVLGIAQAVAYLIRGGGAARSVDLGPVPSGAVVMESTAERRQSAILHRETLPAVAAPVWPLEVVGSTAVDGPLVTWTQHFTVGRDRRVYLVESGTQRIVVFDSAGHRLSTIGSRGAGPLQFRWIVSLAWLGDTLVVYDDQARRLTFIRPDGTLLRTVDWTSSGIPARVLGVSAAALWAALRPSTPVNTSGTPRPETRFVQINADGSTRAPVALRDSTPLLGLGECWGDIPGMLMPIALMRTAPGGAGPLHAVTSTGQFVHSSFDRTTVLWMSPDGRVERRSAPPYADVAVTDTIWRREAGEYFDLERKYGALTCRRLYVRPPAIPAIRSIIADDAGNAWVQVTTPTGSRLDAYDASASLLGSVIMPDGRETPYVVRGGHLYVVAVDRDTLLRVVTYRIRR